MKRLIGRILALGMALCVCLSLCTVSAKAADKSEMPKKGTYGPISLSLSLTRSGDNYTVAYTATMKMAEWLAQAAAVGKDSPRTRDLRFTCTLHDALTEKLDSITGSITNSAKYGGENIVVLDEPNAVTVSKGSVQLRYKLNPTVLKAWATKGAAEIKSSLMQQITMTGSKIVPASILEGIGSTIHTTAQVDISMADGSNIPFYRVKEIEAAYGTRNTSNLAYSGSVMVEVVDKTPSTTDPATGGATPSDIPIGGGTTMVDNPGAGPGDTVRILTQPDGGSMVNYISVTDADGNRIPLTYDGDGELTFEMPHSGGVTVEAWYRVVPADPEETGAARLLNADDHIPYMIGDNEGNFRPDESISRAEVAMAFFRLLHDQGVAITQHFNDVKTTDWYVQPIETLASLHILEGMGDNTFEPNRAITRAEFAAIAARFADELVADTSFADVDEDAWYADFVSTAAHFGWINGMGNGMYEPNRAITRTEAVAIINRMLRRISDWVKVDAGVGRHFPDVSQDHWGRYEISEAANGHSYTLEEKYFYEEWLTGDWNEAADNAPLNFGQPKA